MKRTAVLGVLSVAVMAGFITGLVRSVNAVVAERHIQHGMLRLVALTFQRTCSHWVLLFLLIGVVLLLGVWLLARIARIVWKHFLSRMVDVDIQARVQNWRMLKGCLVFSVCAVWFLCGGWALNRYWLPGRFHPISLAADAVIVAVTVLLAYVLMKARWEALAEVRTIRKMRACACVALVIVLLLNLGITLDEKFSIPQKPNIVWILIDALRADHLGCYGYDRDTSPFMDEFAANSILFENAISQESYTQASVPSYFTSTYPHVNKVLYDSPTIDILDSKFATLAEVLRNAEYATAAFVFNPHLKAAFNFGQGFDVYDDNDAGFDYTLPSHETFETAMRIHNKVERYLQKHRKRPVFLYLHYRDVHSPYVPPPPYHKTYLPPEYTPVVDMIEKGKLPPRKEYMDRYVSQYDGEIRYTDECIKKTVRMLEEYGIDRENTIFIITADHGEEFHDYHPDDVGDVGHRRTLYMEQIHVPLIMSVPASEPVPREVEQYVELADLVPTILDMLEIESKASDQFQGRSVFSLMIGEELEPRRAYSGGNYGRGAVIENGMKYFLYDVYQKELRMGGVRRPPEGHEHMWRDELYDIAKDPGETVNIIAESKELAEELMTVLVAVKGDVTVQAEGESVALDDRTKDQLKALGYLK